MLQRIASQICHSPGGWWCLCWPRIRWSQQRNHQPPGKWQICIALHIYTWNWEPHLLLSMTHFKFCASLLYCALFLPRIALQALRLRTRAGCHTARHSGCRCIKKAHTKLRCVWQPTAVCFKYIILLSHHAAAVASDLQCTPSFRKYLLHLMQSHQW